MTAAEIEMRDEQGNRMAQVFHFLAVSDAGPSKTSGERPHA